MQKTIQAVSSVAFVTLLLLMISGVTPFGSRTLLTGDLNIQYIEYLSFLKHFFNGDSSLVYSFSKSLGGPMIALFGYYLSSPLNIFVVFFSQEKLPIAVTLILSLKIILSGWSIAQYIQYKYPDATKSVMIIGTLGYALSHYTIIQMNNIMWLDAMYLLPLTIMGVEVFQKQGKSRLLYITLVLTIIVNWYMAYMNILFLCIYWLYYYYTESKSRQLKQFFKALRAFMSMLMVSVLTSMCLFYPVIIGLRKGKGGVEPGIFNWATNGTLLQFMKGFYNGTFQTGRGNVIFYSVFLILATGSYFLNRNIRIKSRMASAVMFVFLLASVYIRPLENIWYGFRFAQGAHTRFGHIVLLFAILLALKQLMSVSINSSINTKVIVSYSIAMFLLYYTNIINHAVLFVNMVSIVLIIGIVILKSHRGLSKICVVGLVASELGINAWYTINKMYQIDIEPYRQYVTEQQQLVDAIEMQENSIFYRIDQTLNRENVKNGVTAHFNEGLAFNYPTLSVYSSTYDKRVNQHIARSGYGPDHDTIIGYSEPILAMDSILGLKYVMTQHNPLEYNKVDRIRERNGKSVYENPYALSLGVLTQQTAFNQIMAMNPFDYQNEFFSQLLGETTQVYKKAAVDISIDPEGLLVMSEGIKTQEGLLYGYGKFNVRELPLYIDGDYRTEYSRWLSYSVFSIGRLQDNHTVKIEGVSSLEAVDQLDFYYLDLPLFRHVIHRLKESEVVPTLFEDGQVQFDVQDNKYPYLFTTIPFDEGWHVKVNGSDVEPTVFAGTFMQVPIPEGDVTVNMTYKPEGMMVGAVVSMIGLAGYWILFERHKGDK